MDQLRAMRVFVRVAERGSFTAAAGDLGLSHGMASAIVKEVETRLGVELVRRTTRRMALTEAGEEYLERARVILAEVEALDEALGQGRDRVAGKLVVQVPTSFSRVVLAPSLGDLVERHPELELTLLSRDRYPDMVSEAIDVAIFIGRMPDSGLMTRGLGRFPLVSVASPEYLERHGVPATPDDLERHRLVGIVSATTGRPLEWFYRVDGGRVLRPAPSRVQFDNSVSAVEAAVAGAGILQNMSYAVADAMADGRLIEVLAPWRDPGPELHLLMRRQHRMPARMRVFVAHLEALVRDRQARDLALLG